MMLQMNPSDGTFTELGNVTPNTATQVVSATGEVGRVVGARPCQLESCGGTCLGVRWPDDKLTWPCQCGMSFKDGRYHIPAHSLGRNN